MSLRARVAAVAAVAIVVAVALLGVAVSTLLGAQRPARWTTRCARAPSRSRGWPPPRRSC